jgi:hypothetical protein
MQTRKGSQNLVTGSHTIFGQPARASRTLANFGSKFRNAFVTKDTAGRGKMRKFLVVKYNALVAYGSGALLKCKPAQ